jgi:hypothetical protein
MGQKKLAIVALEDLGKAAAAIFNNNKLIGKDIYICSDHQTGNEIAQLYSKNLGVNVVYNAFDNETFRNLGFPGADDMGNMFQFFHDNNEEFL